MVLVLLHLWMIWSIVENDEGCGGDDINEKESRVKDDDYLAFNTKNLLG